MRLLLLYSVLTHLQVDLSPIAIFNSSLSLQRLNLSPAAELFVLLLANFYQEFHLESLINSASAPLPPPVQMNKRAGKQTDK